MDDEVAIKVEHVSKTFKLPHEKSSSLKSLIVNFSRRKNGYELQEVLNDVSFDIKKGEFFGIVGRNGSGKSTLLKMLAGIYTPTHGSIQVNGKLTPFIELGVGFNHELTGRENVFLNGSLLGFNRKEMSAMYNDIVEFAELERFMDQKLKNYSSGMQVRLAFSIAIRAQSDILLLDEVLAVGDEAFQRKCYDYFGNLKKSKRTVILVSHDMGVIERFCNRAMLIEKGHVMSIDTSSEVAQKYKDLFIQDVYGRHTDGKEERLGIKNKLLKSITFTLEQAGKKVSIIDGKKPFSIGIEFTTNENVGKSACGIEIANAEGTPILSLGIGGRGEEPLEIKEGFGVLKFNILENILNEGTYIINSTLQTYDENNNDVVLFQKTRIKQFSVTGLRIRQHAVAHTKFKALYVSRP